MTNIFSPKFISPTNFSDKSLWFVFSGDDILLAKDNPACAIPQFDNAFRLALNLQSQHYLGDLDGQHCFCAEVASNAKLTEQLFFQPLRKAHPILGDTLFKIACRALQILHWDTIYQYCARCGNKMDIKADERAKYCSHCHLHFYPKLSPSVIVAIERGDEILLARSPHFTPGVFGLLAGFIEPGETAEEAVAREVMEEVSIKIKDIRYVLSQHWPFPDSFMLGFTAQYASGDIVIDGKEIEAAGWYTINNLPKLPSSASIGKRLINQFIEKHK
jgi:NAD+ diphosphatase